MEESVGLEVEPAINRRKTCRDAVNLDDVEDSLFFEAPPPLISLKRKQEDLISVETEPSRSVKTRPDEEKGGTTGRGPSCGLNDCNDSSRHPGLARSKTVKHLGQPTRRPVDFPASDKHGRACGQDADNLSDIDQGEHEGGDATGLKNNTHNNGVAFAGPSSMSAEDIENFKESFLGSDDSDDEEGPPQHQSMVIRAPQKQIEKTEHLNNDEHGSKVRVSPPGLKIDSNVHNGPVNGLEDATSKQSIILRVAPKQPSEGQNGGLVATYSSDDGSDEGSPRNQRIVPRSASKQPSGEQTQSSVDYSSSEEYGDHAYVLEISESAAKEQVACIKHRQKVEKTLHKGHASGQLLRDTTLGSLGAIGNVGVLDSLIFEGSRRKLTYPKPPNNPGYLHDISAANAFDSVMKVAVGVAVAKARDEDRHLVDLNRTIGNNVAAFFAVMDGHGDDASAEYIQEHILALLDEYPDLLDRFHHYMQAVSARIEDGLREVHQEKKLLASSNDEAVRKTLKRDDTSGTTGLFAFVSDGKNGKRLNIGNVGDTEGVMCRENGDDFDVTVRHNMSNLDEYNRIMEADPSCIANGRVNGKLTVTRAFGDGEIKDACPEAFTAEAALRTIMLKKTDEFLIMGTDGVFDAFETKADVVNFVRDGLQKSKNPTAVAKELTEEAQKVTADDCTAIIVVFQP